MLLSDISDEEFVEVLYQTLLDRPPEDEGKQNHIDALKSSDRTRIGLVAQFMESKEYVDNNNLDTAGWYHGKVVQSKWQTQKGYYLKNLLRSVHLSPNSNVVEFGVWRGKSASQIASTVDSDIYLFDTFNGFPRDTQYPCHENSTQSGDVFQDTSKELVEARMEKFENDVHIVHGDLLHTKTEVPDEVSFVHFDLDVYSTTKDVLEHCFNAVKKGGIIMFDEYSLHAFQDEERRAVDEFFDSSPHEVVELPTGQAFVIK